MLICYQFYINCLNIYHLSTWILKRLRNVLRYRLSISLLNSFCWGIQSKAFLKLTKHEKSKFRCLCGLDFTYLSTSIFNVKMLPTVPCIFLKPPCSAFKIPF